MAQQERSGNVKFITVIGFVLAILLLLWLAVQLVSFIPSAFNSLASLADGVNNYRPTADLSIATPNSVVNSGDAFTVTWEQPRQEGVYEFSYECAEGATTVDVRYQNDIIPLVCGESLTLESGTAEIELSVMTADQRFTDVVYTLAFVPENGNDAVVETDTVTIVNASIAAGTVAETEVETEIVEAPVSEPEGEVAGESADEAPETTPTTPAEQPIYYRTVETPIYAIPQSDPNGTVDLAVSLVGVGYVVNNTFYKSNTITTRQTGAIRFVVKNIGTKTSDEWTYNAELPADIDFESNDQAPLKPNEEAFITLSFAGADRDGVELVTVDIETDEDAVSTNNNLFWAITIID